MHTLYKILTCYALTIVLPVILEIMRSPISRKTGRTSVHKIDWLAICSLCIWRSCDKNDAMSLGDKMKCDIR